MDAAFGLADAVAIDGSRGRVIIGLCVRSAPRRAVPLGELEMVQRNLSRRFSPQDAAFLYFDTDAAPMNVGSVFIFEGEIPFDEFVESVASKLHLVPRYRQRVVPPPFNIGRPTWEYDPNFAIRRHIHRLRIEPPGTDSQLADLAARLYAGRAGRGGPLWGNF